MACTSVLPSEFSNQPRNGMNWRIWSIRPSSGFSSKTDTLVRLLFSLPDGAFSRLRSAGCEACSRCGWFMGKTTTTTKEKVKDEGLPGSCDFTDNMEKNRPLTGQYLNLGTRIQKIHTRTGDINNLKWHKKSSFMTRETKKKKIKTLHRFVVVGLFPQQTCLVAVFFFNVII